MRIDMPQVEVAASAAFPTAEMRIDTSANAKLFDIVIAKLYENRTRFLFELTANAYDAAPGLAPVIHLPTAFDSTFRVTDRGPGMSRDFMLSGYASVFHSTKDGDDTAVGGWGIGRLSALAVAPSYSVESCHGGSVDIYSVFRAENGVPRVTHLASEPAAGRPTGVTVEVPIAAEDRRAIVDAAQLALGFWSPAPTVNVTVEPIRWTMPGIAELRQPYVVCGGYPYPVDRYETGGKLGKFADLYTNGSALAAVVYLPVGAVEVTANRERLRYTDKTIEALRIAAQEFVERTAAVQQQEADALASPWEAAIWFNGRSARVPYFLAALLPRPSWQGKPIATDFNVPDGVTATYVSRTRGRRGNQGKLRSDRCPYLSGSAKVASRLFLDDTAPDAKVKPLRAVKAWLDANGHDEAWIVSRAFVDGMEPTPVSTLPPPPAAERATGGPRLPVMLRCWDHYSRKWERDGSSDHLAATADAFVRLKGGEPVDDSDRTLLSSPWMTYTTRVVGVPSTWKGELPGVPSLAEYTKAAALAELDRFELAFELAFAEEREALEGDANDAASFLLDRANDLTGGNLPGAARLFLDLAARSTFAADHAARLEIWLPRLGIVIPKHPSLGLGTLLSSLLAARPLLPFIAASYSYRSGEHLPAILTYLNGKG